MKSEGKKRALTFGDRIAASYHAWGARRAKGFVRRLAVNAHLKTQREGLRDYVSRAAALSDLERLT